MSTDKHSRLVGEAIILKKAWLFLMVLLGYGEKLSQLDRTIPNYRIWKNKPLKQHIKDLEQDFEHIAKRALCDCKKGGLYSKAEWFAARFDDWEMSGFGLYEVGRVHEVERAIGRLTFHNYMDCPPYAQMLLQGRGDPALRHPEYHLGSDLALFYNLLLDSEELLEKQQLARKQHNSEHSQSLARGVILTCFNLLESFVSGFVTTYLMENPSAPTSLVEKLKDKRLSLRRRLIEYPALIACREGVIDGNQPPFEPLLGECKRRRDSFVHCEPGVEPTVWGYVKEKEFHAANLNNARQTVDLTIAAICQIWKVLYGKDRPTWLPTRDKSGRFERITVKLTPLEITLPVRNSG